MATRRVLLLGGSGYVGEAFRVAIETRGHALLSPSRKQLDYYDFAALTAFLREQRPDFLVNCAGFTGRPNVDACESAKADTLLGTGFLPLTLAHACEVTQTPWGHVSSGCIFSGAKLVTSDGVRVVKNLRSEEGRALLDAGAEIQGFTEADTPNFSFRDPPCSFYSGSKALGEEVLAGAPLVYVWRLRIPFDQYDGPRNYLTKLFSYPKVYDNVNSLSHRGHFARACLDLWQNGAPFGTYNMTNPGFVSSREVVELIKKHLFPERAFDFWQDDAEFYAKGALTPRSNCVLDSTKAIKAGAGLPPVHDALIEALRTWSRRA